MKAARVEITQLYDIIKRQAQTIDLVERGKFSGGIMSFNIPKSDKPV